MLWLALWACGATAPAAITEPPAAPAPPVDVAPAEAPSAPQPPVTAGPPTGGVHVLVPEEQVKGILEAGERLAHKPLQGPVGPAISAHLLVVERDGRLFPVLKAGDAAPLRGPALHDEWRAFDVPAVMFLDADGAPGVEMIVLAQCITGIGPEGAVPFPCNAVVAFDGTSMRRLAAPEASIAKATRAAEVRSALTSPKGG